MVGPHDAGTLSLSQEELRINKEAVVTGRVRVRTTLETVEEIARAELSAERVDVTRIPVGREVTTAPPIRTEGDTTIIPVLEEIMVVVKQLVLKEELHIRRVVTHETHEVPITLRKQRGVIERVGTDPSPPAAEESAT